ncbi:MAG: SprB repeat-containing protein, partial [Saprospiraceae bacterium]|nr:SprB repeat-containing protein [Saprospiraceae bacterium]
PVDISCYGSSDGSAELYMQNYGGTPPYQILWGSSAGNQTSWTASSLSGGNHSYSVTDANGCISTGSVYINGPSNPITGNVVVTDASCVGCSDGAIQITASGGWSNGASNYVFQLSPGFSQIGGVTSATFSSASSGDPIAAGTYSIEIQDYTTGPPCFATINNIVVNEPAVVASFITAQDGPWNNGSTWVGGAVPASYDHATIAHNVLINLDIQVDGDITIGANNSLSINAGNVLMHSGSLDNNGSISGSYNLTGSTRTINIGEVEDLIVSVTGTISANTDCSISRLLRVDTGAIIDVTGYQAILLADASSTALVHDNGGTTVGDFTVEQFIPNAGYPYANIFYGTPVNNATIAQIDDDCNMLLASSGNPNVYYYDEVAALWTAPTTLAHPMANGEGFYQYAYVPPGGIEFDFTGELNTGNISIPLSNSGNGGGWNIVSNPYPAPIDLYELWGLNSNPAVYYRYNGSSYNSFIAPVGISNPPGLTKYVPLMQGFWVNAGGFTSITFNNNDRVTDPAQAVDDFTKSTMPIFRLAMQHQSERVSSVVYFYNEATDDVDENYDALYLDGDNSFQFATKTGNTNMSINGLSELDGSIVTIPLHTEVTAIDNYTLSLTELSNFSAGTKVMLQDLLLAVSHDLTKGDYSYIGNPVEGNDRFIITVLSAVVSTDKVEDVATFEAYRCYDNLCILLPKLLEDNASINIYNALGQNVYTSTLEEGKQFWSIDKINLSGTSVYFVDIEGYESASKIVWE